VKNPDTSAMEQAVFQCLGNAIENSYGHPELTRSSRLSGLGLDSLKLVEIVYELETRFSVATDEDMLAELVTVADLIRVFEHATMHPDCEPTKR